MPTNSVNLATYKAVKASKAVGSATLPVYIASDGTFTACSELSSASTWATARTITLTGSVTGSISIDGSSDVTLVTTTNHNHDWRYPQNHITSFAFTDSNQPFSRYVTFDVSNPAGGPGGWVNGFMSVHNDYLASYIVLEHRTDNWYLGWNEYSRTNGTVSTAPVWRKILHSGNYTSYTVTKTGSGASGTWGISISGNAATATKATQDGSGNVITSKYVTIDTTQTITGTKSFGASGAGCLINGAGSNGGINSIRIGDDVWLGDCNASGIMGMKSTSSNCGFYMYNSSGTLIGTMYFNGSLLLVNKPIYATSNTMPLFKIERSDSAETSMYFKNATAGWAIGIHAWGVGAGVFAIGQYSGTGGSAWRFKIDNSGYCYASSRLYHAVWNDFAEFRTSSFKESGYVVIDDGKGTLHLCNERLAAGARIISDTYGSSVGYSLMLDTPIGVAGRVLAYPYRDKSEYHVGDAVCSAPHGKIDVMTREEIIIYPERILGIVSEIPDYDIWVQLADDVSEPISILVNNRIWIYVR